MMMKMMRKKTIIRMTSNEINLYLSNFENQRYESKLK